jgi:hypothetical protein
MKKVKLSDWFELMKESELSNVEDGNVNKVEEFKKLCNEFWKVEGEDREIVLEDLKKDEGILYKKMIEWNENELVIEEDLNMVWWEYSLEDYFRDMFGIIREESKFNRNDEYNIFEIEDINKMMYGEDYNKE